jgi:hypothetical protein
MQSMAGNSDVYSNSCESFESFESFGLRVLIIKFHFDFWLRFPDVSKTRYNIFSFPAQNGKMEHDKKESKHDNMDTLQTKDRFWT